MRDVSQYFDLLAKAVEFVSDASAELEFERVDHSRGTIEGVLYFADGSRLEFTEKIVIESSRPVKRDYRYQYVRAGEAVFRYDNAAHHSHLATFPHHKHIGNEMLPAIEPTLKQVLDEVNELLPESKDSSSSQPKRRRQRKPRR
jgi:hypothetical protein